MNQREDEREGWPVKPYYKRDLAVAYAPDITPVAALNRLSSWVHHHKVLYRALADSGYTDRQRMFNSVQVELIFRRDRSGVCLLASPYGWKRGRMHELTRIYVQPHTYICAAPHIRSHEAMHTFVWTAFIPRGIPLRFRALHSVRRDGGCNTRFPCGKAACLCA
jgi:hypothetical protein